MCNYEFDLKFLIREFEQFICVMRFRFALKATLELDEYFSTMPSFVENAFRMCNNMPSDICEPLLSSHLILAAHFNSISFFFSISCLVYIFKPESFIHLNPLIHC